MYRPYNSTLSRYPLLGGRPSASLSIPFHPSPLSSSISTEPTNPSTDVTNDFYDTGSAGLSTFVAQKRQLDPGRKWCKAETLGGVCQDGGCKGVHGRDWIAKGERNSPLHPCSSFSSSPDLSLIRESFLLTLIGSLLSLVYSYADAEKAEYLLQQHTSTA